ncbi:MAG: hypothetical protein COW30_12020 [Rhodospirillales bacterium CG15_BIG_FIL_POST_REV_8_21_14_020_66_15]|nr:MAG: hypothetical protein COW30_12020 [Rhodospirillales bacterium CG15_BIG_FIL_POST_REV_8_21_14_020_66_15]
MSDNSQDGILDLWPTKLVRRHLPDFEEPTQALVKLIRDMERVNRNLTTDYLAPDFFNLDDPAVGWLREQVNATVVDYLRAIGIDYDVRWTIHGWPNVNRLGDYHDAHNHPRSYLSGTYYLKVPATKEPMRNRADLRPSHITFYDPRPGINMNSIKGDPYVDPEFTVLPEPGLLMMWPAFLNHFIHPNLSKETRVTVSFNIVLKWQDHYLPTQ